MRKVKVYTYRSSRRKIKGLPVKEYAKQLHETKREHNINRMKGYNKRYYEQNKPLLVHKHHYYNVLNRKKRAKYHHDYNLSHREIKMKRSREYYYSHKKKYLLEYKVYANATFIYKLYILYYMACKKLIRVDEDAWAGLNHLKIDMRADKYNDVIKYLLEVEKNGRNQRRNRASTTV